MYKGFLHSSGKWNRATGSCTGGRLLTTKQATRLLNVPANTLRRWNDRELLWAWRVGPAAQRRYREEDIADLLLRLTEVCEVELDRLSRQ